MKNNLKSLEWNMIAFILAARNSSGGVEGKAMKIETDLVKFTTNLNMKFENSF